MIAKLNGIIDSCYHDHVILDVNGVGYLVFCSNRTLANLVPGISVVLLIETYVTENQIQLYGFFTEEEKKHFLLLHSINGVGKKMSLVILSILSPDKINFALLTRDATILRRVPGIGKKLAERIVNELKDKYTSEQVEVSTCSSKEGCYNSDNTAKDCISALVSLGVRKIEAQKRTEEALLQNKNISLTELIKLALKKRISN